jgi:hypothetical protein
MVKVISFEAREASDSALTEISEALSEYELEFRSVDEEYYGYPKWVDKWVMYIADHVLSKTELHDLMTNVLGLSEEQINEG